MFTACQPRYPPAPSSACPSLVRGSSPNLSTFDVFPPSRWLAVLGASGERRSALYCARNVSRGIRPASRPLGLPARTSLKAVEDSACLPEENLKGTTKRDTRLGTSAFLRLPFVSSSPSTPFPRSFTGCDRTFSRDPPRRRFFGCQLSRRFRRLRARTIFPRFPRRPRQPGAAGRRAWSFDWRPGWAVSYQIFPSNSVCNIIVYIVQIISKWVCYRGTNSNRVNLCICVMSFDKKVRCTHVIRILLNTYRLTWRPNSKTGRVNRIVLHRLEIDRFMEARICIVRKTDGVP